MLSRDPFRRTRPPSALSDRPTARVSSLLQTAPAIASPPRGGAGADGTDAPAANSPLAAKRLSRAVPATPPAFPIVELFASGPSPARVSVREGPTAETLDRTHAKPPACRSRDRIDRWGGDVADVGGYSPRRSRSSQASPVPSNGSFGVNRPLPLD